MQSYGVLIILGSLLVCTGVSMRGAWAPPAGGGTSIDLVVERHCEDLSWLSDISSSLRRRLRVFIYDKPGEACQPTLASEFPADLHVTVEELRNVARDGHDQMQHIIDHYDDLGTHVAFVQAGVHWTLRGLGRRSKGWNSNQAALNDLLPKLTESDKFTPFTMYSTRGPVLWQDREDNGEPSMWDQVNVMQFETGFNDMYNRARELYAMFFGGTPCEAPPQWFTAGMQYIVHQDHITRHPLKFWKAVQEKMVSCDPTMGYVWERLTTSVFNSSAVAVDPSSWREPEICKTQDWTVFNDPFNRTATANFWHEKWGCEPLSQAWLKRHAAGGMRPR